MVDPRVDSIGHVIGREDAAVNSADVLVSRIEDRGLLVLRVAAQELEAADRALGFRLSRRIGETSNGGPVRALCLGPDEWWLVTPADLSAAVADAFRKSVGAAAHSLIDIGHRDLTLEVRGPSALWVLGGGCPLDLAGMEVDRATRTLFGAAEIVLFRREPAAFEVIITRSYTPYVEALLRKIAREPMPPL